MFVPATCPGTGLGVLRPVEYTWTETGGGVSWEKVGGGTCAGPQFATEHPWTRAPAGQIAVESGNDIALMDAGGFFERKLTDQHGTDPNVWPDWSPDGSRIVFAGASQEGYDLYTMAADGTGAERITHEPGDEIMPSWSPDGTRIAFAFDDLGVPDFETGIVVVGTSGEARAELVTRQNQLVESPIWSPDGTRIAFTVFSENGDRPVTYVMDQDGGDLVEVREEAVALSWTPDGKRIVLSAYGSLLAVRPDGTGRPCDPQVSAREQPARHGLVARRPMDRDDEPVQLGDSQRVPDAVRWRRTVPRGERLGAFMASGIRLTSGGDDVRTDAPGVPNGVTTSTEISPEELQLSQRNHGMQLEGLRYDVTPAGMHYLLIHFDVPEADESSWRLSVGGLVRQPLELSMAELRSRPSVTMPVTMECAGNGRARLSPRPISQPWITEAIGTAEWTGTPLRSILEEAGIEDEAVELVFRGADHGIQGGVEQDYERSLTIEDAMRDEVLLAYAMNGDPLPPQHGFPLRLVVPGWYGMTSVKWLASIDAVAEPFDGFQMDSYRVRQQPEDEGEPVTRMSPRSLLVPPGFPDFLTRRRFVDVGRHVLKGRAWSGWGRSSASRSVRTAVTWADATVGDPASPFSWVPWTFTWDASRPGAFELCCRATDAAGNTQPLEQPWNLHGFSNNMVQRVPVEVRTPA